MSSLGQVYLDKGRPATITGGTSTGGGPATPAFSETLSFNIKIADSNANPTDTATFGLNLAESESSAAPTEAVKLGISGTGVNDSNAAPTEAKTFTMRIWLSGTAAGTPNGVTNPANENGQNDGAVCTIQSAVTGSATPNTSSVVGANIPSGVTITSAIYRGWFKSVNTLVTSNGQVYAQGHGVFSPDVQMFINAGLNTTIDHSTGDFTFDLIAAGINTLAKLQAMTVQHVTNDAVAGVTPHVLTVDAGAIELAGAFT